MVSFNSFKYLKNDFKASKRSGGGGGGGGRWGGSHCTHVPKTCAHLVILLKLFTCLFTLTFSLTVVDGSGNQTEGIQTISTLLPPQVSVFLQINDQFEGSFFFFLLTPPVVSSLSLLSLERHRGRAGIFEQRAQTECAADNGQHAVKCRL